MSSATQVPRLDGAQLLTALEEKRSAVERITNLPEQRRLDRERAERKGKKTQTKYRIFATFVRLTHSPKRQPITVDAICGLAQVSTATFYKHFTHGVDELVFHLSLRLAEHVVDRVNFDCDKLGVTNSADDRMTVTVARMADVLTRYPSLFAVDTFSDAAREQLSAPLLVALLSGDKGAISMNLRTARIAALYQLNGLIALLTIDPPMDYREIAEIMVRQVIPTDRQAASLKLLGQLAYDKTENDKDGRRKRGYVHLPVTWPSKPLINLWVPLSAYKPPKAATRRR